MATFLDLPPEIRRLIYDELLVDPIKSNARLMCTSDALGKSNWSRIVEPMPTNNKLTTRQASTPVKSSVSFIDYSNLWSLISTTKLLYVEATPTMYMHAQLEYIHGDTPGTRQSPTLLHTYLEKLLPATRALHHHLTIHYGREGLSAKDMRVLVDTINLKLPNLLSLSIQAVNPAIEAWPKIQWRGLSEDYLKTLGAARPVARLNSRPVISIKPRARLYVDIDAFKNTTVFRCLVQSNWKRMLRIIHSMVSIRDWRCEAQQYHTIACQQGDYLLLTSPLRSNLAGATGIDAVEGFDDTEDRLVKHQDVLSLIMEHDTLRKEQAACLRKVLT